MEMKCGERTGSMPLDTGNNRMSYNWTPELQRQFGDSFSAFCDFDLLQGVVAYTMKDNPCLNESCYYDISDELAAVPSGHMTCEEWDYYLSKQLSERQFIRVQTIIRKRR